MEELFFFGEEFEVVLDILEDDEELEDEFIVMVKDVSSKYLNFGLVFWFNVLKFMQNY